MEDVLKKRERSTKCPLELKIKRQKKGQRERR